LYGTHHGTGAITRVTGIHGIHTPGITTMGISITGTVIITDITASGTIIAIQDGMTFITMGDVHIHRIFITE
jgi:hypothetical protein